MKFEVPQRQQLASERTSLTLFAPALSTTSFVPLTRNFSPAAPSPYPGVDRPLRGNCHPLQSIHRLLNVPPVATVKLVNAYQFEKFGTGNSLLRYGIRIRCSKRLPGVRDASSEEFGVKNSLLRYGRDIRCAKQASVVRDAFSKARRTAPATLNDFQRPAKQPTPHTVDSLLGYATHFQRRAVPKAAPAAAAAASVRETPTARR